MTNGHNWNRLRDIIYIIYLDLTIRPDLLPLLLFLSKDRYGKREFSRRSRASMYNKRKRLKPIGEKSSSCRSTSYNKLRIQQPLEALANTKETKETKQTEGKTAKY